MIFIEFMVLNCDCTFGEPKNLYRFGQLRQCNLKPRLNKLNYVNNRRIKRID